jgi:hypothetical protein
MSNIRKLHNGGEVNMENPQKETPSEQQEQTLAKENTLLTTNRRVTTNTPAFFINPLSTGRKAHRI